MVTAFQRCSIGGHIQSESHIMDKSKEYSKWQSGSHATREGMLMSFRHVQEQYTYCMAHIEEREKGGGSLRSVFFQRQSLHL